MPSPFPGMDPFLEDPSHFPDLHHHLITYLQEMLQPRLPEPYFAKTGERVWVEVSRREVASDVSVSRSDRGAGREEEPETAALAIREETEPVIVCVETVPEFEWREGYLEIYTHQGNVKRLVTAIEVLSPSNKSSAGEGRALYLKKQQEVLSGDAHLVEIDLLRAGRHTTAVPRDLAVAKAGQFDYHVSVHCFTEPDLFYVFPIQLSQRLPRIPIPLLPGDLPVVIDLQAVFDRCYNAGSYSREIEYRKEIPSPPLRPDQMEWMRGVVASHSRKR